MKHFFKNSTVHHYFFLGLILALSLGQLQRIQLDSGLAFYLHDCIIVLWLITAGVRQYFFRSELSPLAALGAFFTTHLRHSPSLWLLCWIALSTSIASSSENTLIPILYLIRLATYLALLIFLAQAQVLSTNWLKQGVIAVGLTWLTLGFLQLAVLPDLRSLRWLGFDDHYYRLASTFFDPNFAGLSFVLTLLFTLLFFSWKRFDWRLLLTAVVLATGIAATYSRASYLSLAAALVAYVLSNKTARTLQTAILSTAVAIGVVAWILLPKPGGEGVDLARTASISARTSASSTELQSLTPITWLTGKGLYTSGAAFSIHREQLIPNHARVPDNLFIMLLVSGGLPAVVLGVAALLEWFNRFWRWQPASVAALTALVLHAQFNNSLLEPFIFLFVGVGTIVLYRTNVTTRS